MRAEATQAGDSGAEPAAVYDYGFDRLAYPGDTIMQNLWTKTSLAFTGFYLAPAPDHPDTSWMAKRATLKNMGWGFAVIYVGRQAGWTNLTYAQGQTDGTNAANLASQAGFPANTVLFLDIETGGTLPTNLISYIQGWANQVWFHTQYDVGVYCSFYQSAAQIHTALSSIPSVVFWCWNINCGPSVGCLISGSAPNPANCGVSYAAVWQYAQSPLNSVGNCSGYKPSGTHYVCEPIGDYPSLDMDLDCATSANPSNG